MFGLLGPTIYTNVHALTALGLHNVDGNKWSLVHGVSIKSMKMTS